MDEQVVSNVTEPAAQESQAPTFTPEQQALMNRVVAREKTKAAESARREAELKYQQEMEALNAQRAQQAQRNENVSREFDTDAIYQQVQEKFNRDMQERQQKAHAEEIANSYHKNISQGKTAYEDFDEVTKDFDPTQFMQIAYLLAGDPNAAGTLYDLMKNPSKLAMIDRLAEKSPRIAQAELQKLSKSIADNKQAQLDAQDQEVSEPLDRLTPSRIAGSNGKKSISDLRNEPWMRA